MAREDDLRIAKASASSASNLHAEAMQQQQQYCQQLVARLQQQQQFTTTLQQKQEHLTATTQQQTQELAAAREQQEQLKATVQEQQSQLNTTLLQLVDAQRQLLLARPPLEQAQQPPQPGSGTDPQAKQQQQQRPPAVASQQEQQEPQQWRQQQEQQQWQLQHQQQWPPQHQQQRAVTAADGWTSALQSSAAPTPVGTSYDRQASEGGAAARQRPSHSSATFHASRASEAADDRCAPAKRGPPLQHAAEAGTSERPASKHARYAAEVGGNLTGGSDAAEVSEPAGSHR
jgi:hypothetical protein